MRYLHTMVRVSDLDKSLAFYCDTLGLQEIRRMDRIGQGGQQQSRDARPDGS